MEHKNATSLIAFYIHRLNTRGSTSQVIKLNMFVARQ